MPAGMTPCKRCGSFAINPRMHGREIDVDTDLCDVCYWRKRAEDLVAVRECLQTPDGDTTSVLLNILKYWNQDKIKRLAEALNDRIPSDPDSAPTKSHASATMRKKPDTWSSDLNKESEAENG